MKTGRLTRAALMAVLTLAAGFIRIPAGPVPVTLQTLFVFMTGLLFDPALSALTMTLHLGLKLVIGGTATALSPTFGFLLAFIPAAALLSFMVGREDFRWSRAILALLSSLALTYAVGFLHVALVFPDIAGPAFWLSTLLFLPGDILKGGLALILARRLRPFLMDPRT